MKVVLVFGLLVVSTFAVPSSPLLHQKWLEFKVTHNKSYPNAVEETKRFKIFQDNLFKIDAHNEKYAKGEVTYKKSINHFGDMTKEEFLSYVNRGKINKPHIPRKVSKPFVPSNAPLAVEVDWRKKNVVTDVKDQGQCGSCWSFSATGAVEGQLAINGRGLISLSEQNLMDCSNDYGNAGCDGGDMVPSFEYIRDNGIEKEEDYPYEAEDGRCRYDPSLSVTSLSGYQHLPSGDESALQQAVAEIGPIAVGLDATDELQFYDSGYFYDDICESDYDALNHGVLAVGYGSSSQGDYWIVKNSWGTGWGESGYFNLARNAGNNCGIATDASYPEL